MIWVGVWINRRDIETIKRQKRFAPRTKEVLSKVYQVVIFCFVAITLLQLLGINLTTLAVFGGAVGVGLGLGCNRLPQTLSQGSSF